MADPTDIKNPLYNSENVTVYFKDSDGKGGIYTNTYKGDASIIIPETQPAFETPALISAENGKYIERTIFQFGTAKVWLNTIEDVVAGVGIPLEQGDSLTDDKSKSAWYAVAEEIGTVGIQVLQVVKDEIE